MRLQSWFYLAVASLVCGVAPGHADTPSVTAEIVSRGYAGTDDGVGHTSLATTGSALFGFGVAVAVVRAA